MSKEAVEQIIGKAAMDPNFRNDLFMRTKETLAGFDLTDEEMAGLMNIDNEMLESFAGSLDERMSKVRLPGPRPQ
jgi:Ribosomally synthesized peptide prototyped by Frankia Franean1_4349.